MNNKQIAALHAARDITIQSFRTMEGVLTNSFNGLIASLQHESEPAKDDCYMSVIKAAAYLCMPPDSLYKLMMKNQITYIRPNRGKAYFKKSDLDIYMEKGRILSNEELTGKG